jgi:hypothetical protein
VAREAFLYREAEQQGQVPRILPTEKSTEAARVYTKVLISGIIMLHLCFSMLSKSTVRRLHKCGRILYVLKYVGTPTYVVMEEAG